MSKDHHRMLQFQFNMLRFLLFGESLYMGKLAPSAITQYSLLGFDFNEIGMGPVGVAVMLMIIIVPLLVIAICVKFCCCHCNRCGSVCRSNKKEKAPKPAPKGWRRCFFRKKEEKELVLPMIMRDTTEDYQAMSIRGIQHMEAQDQVYEDLDKANEMDVTRSPRKFNIPFRPKII